jgi:hypothetical protein
MSTSSPNCVLRLVSVTDTFVTVPDKPETSTVNFTVVAVRLTAAACGRWPIRRNTNAR